MFLPFFSCIWKTPASMITDSSSTISVGKSIFDTSRMTRITDSSSTLAESVKKSKFDGPRITNSSSTVSVEKSIFDTSQMTRITDSSSTLAESVKKSNFDGPRITKSSSPVSVGKSIIDASRMTRITDSSSTLAESVKKSNFDSTVSVGKSIFDASRTTELLFFEKMTGIMDGSSTTTESVTKSTQPEEYTLDELACFLDAQNCLKIRITNDTSNDVSPIEIASIPMNQIILVIILVAEIGLIVILIFISLMICRFQNKKKNSSQHEPIVLTSIENQNFNFSLTQEIGDVKTVAKEKISHFQPDSEDSEIYFVER